MATPFQTQGATYTLSASYAGDTQESLFFVAVLRLKKRGGGMEGRLQPEKNDK